MNKHLYICLLFLSLFEGIKAQPDLKKQLKQHVYTLASNSLHGRKAGSRYASMAKDYIVNQLREINVSPYMEENYIQEFEGMYRNIIGIIPGNDSLLKQEYIVVGAHYDHLGFRETDNKKIIYNGADDNASGVAILIEFARILKEKQTQLKRSVIVIAFDAEELGLLGSGYFVSHPVVPIENIKLMLSVDMVGCFKKSKKLVYTGSGTINEGKEKLLNKDIIPEGLHVKTKKFEKSIFTATDTEAFAQQKIPTLAVTTGLKSPYHKPEDDANLIDYDGMELIVRHLTNFVLDSSSQDTGFQASGMIARKHKTRPIFEYGFIASLGSGYHHYTKGSFEGKSGGFYSMGVTTQFNLKRFGIRQEVMYERSKAKYPGGEIVTDNLTVPVSAVVNLFGGNQGGFELLLGGYYTHRFNGRQELHSEKLKLDFTNDFRRYEYGITWGLGITLRPIRIGYTNRHALSPFTRNKNEDNAWVKNRVNYFSVAYLF